MQPIARRIHLPFTATLVIAGYLASELVVAAGFDTGIRAENFHTLILFVFLPVLIFESAFNTDVHLLVRNLVPILFLAIPMMLLSTLVTAALVYAGIAHPGGFPWIAALLTGALLSATDPVAVVTLFRQLGVPERLVVLMEGESLFNDATAIVVFGILLSLASGMAESVTIGSVTIHFLKVFFGGVLIGGLFGLIMLVILRYLEESIIKALLTVISAYLAFIVAESMLHVSGVVAVLITGLMLGNKMKVDKNKKSNFTRELWEFNAYVANALVFLLMGVTVTLLMFEERWLAMLIGIASVILARSFGILIFVPLLSKLTPIEPIGGPSR